MNEYMTRLSLAVFLYFSNAIDLTAQKTQDERKERSAPASQAFTLVLRLTPFRGLVCPCLLKLGIAMQCPQSPQKRGSVSAGLGFSEASAESCCWHKCVKRVAEQRKCQRVNGIIRPQPSKLPPTQACQILQEKSSRRVSFFTCLMAEKRMHLREACGANAN